MATVTGITAARALAIEAASIVDGTIVDDNLILTRYDGSQIDAGPVVGSADVLFDQPVLDVGVDGQIRAGRQLSSGDFTVMGLSTPLGLWNLGTIDDSSGNSRHLTNKGSVAFTTGINGEVSTAARFNGSATQALYINDAGGSDSFRLRSGSWGCWFKTSKKGVTQTLMSKGSATEWGFFLEIDATTGHLRARVGAGASAADIGGVVIEGVTNVCDDQWHFVVFTYDGAFKVLYVDGVVQHFGYMAAPGGISSGPFNIGAAFANTSEDASSMHYGAIDEAFVTSDVLTVEQIQNLHCVRIPHSLGTLPSQFSLTAQRLRRGISLLSGYFPSTPVRLYNFLNGVLTDSGSGGVNLTNNGSAVAIAGVDGTYGNAYNFSGAQSLSNSDAGLPDALNTRSYGCWFQARTASAMAIMGYGTVSTGDVRAHIDSSGELNFANGANNIDTGIDVIDGKWHFLVVVEDNTALNGVKRKCYLDGKMIGSSTVMNSITLAGANRFRVGGNADGSSLFDGLIDNAFVCDYALTSSDILSLYTRGTQNPGNAPLDPEEFIEAVTDTEILANFLTLDNTHLVNLTVNL